MHRPRGLDSRAGAGRVYPDGLESEPAKPGGERQGPADQDDRPGNRMIAGKRSRSASEGGRHRTSIIIARSRSTQTGGRGAPPAPAVARERVFRKCFLKSYGKRSLTYRKGGYTMKV